MDTQEQEFISENMELFNSADNFSDKHDVPFALGVFGTLRIIPNNQGNARLMVGAKGRQIEYKHQRAFVPHVLPSGIWVDLSVGASGIFEIFSYSPEDFADIIVGVDMLEGFNPKSSSRWGGYHRTLVNAKLLPDDYPNDLFEKGIRFDNRDLGISQEEWSNYEEVPAWIYSNATLNRQLEELENSPLIWWHKEGYEK